MRFKIFYDEASKKIDVSCLHENGIHIMLPDNPEQHVVYPIPTDFKSKLKPVLVGLVDPSLEQEFKVLDKQLKEIGDRRRDLMNKIRKETNPKIIKACEKFRLDNAELFI